MKGNPMTEQNAPPVDAELVEVAAKTLNDTYDVSQRGEITNLDDCATAVIAAIAPAIRAQERAKIAKQFDDVRSELNNISRATEDEGDRVYFGSTNDADDLRSVTERFENFVICAELAIEQEAHNA